YLWLLRGEGRILAGEHQLDPGDNMVILTRKLVTGDAVVNETIVQFIEGWTLRDMAEYLDKKNLMPKENFLQLSTVTDVRTLLPEARYAFLDDKPTEKNLEGYLFPDTYHVFKDPMPADVVKKMLDNLEQKLSQELQEKIRIQGRTVFEVMTLASILEREVQSDVDMRNAADVFLKRIKIGMPLQSDATVNYITGKKTTRPTLEDLAADSLYNTYKYTGLPPGPISNPGMTAIRAAIEPTTNDYYYFITNTAGEAVFARTLEEHQKNIQQYLNQ
ncbi:MAG: endolytic transglycosylase MltG, partial [Patescibacteria group bacterium]